MLEQVNYYLLRLWVWHRSLSPWVRFLVDLLFVPAFLLLIVLIGMTAIFLYFVLPITFYGRFLAAALLWIVILYGLSKAIRSFRHKNLRRKI